MDGGRRKRSARPPVLRTRSTNSLSRLPQSRRARQPKAMLPKSANRVETCDVPRRRRRQTTTPGTVRKPTKASCVTWKFPCLCYRQCPTIRASVTKKAVTFLLKRPCDLSCALAYLHHRHNCTSQALRFASLGSNRSHKFPYRSLKTASMPYGSRLGSRTNSTPFAL